MAQYLLKRVLLIIPTLIGIMLVNFILVQFLPGGPIETVMSMLEGEAGDRVSGSGGLNFEDGGYSGRDNITEEYIARLEAQYGFDQPPVTRFLNMIWDYARFDFGESFFRNGTVLELVKQALPVSISLGLWSTLIIYLVSIPLGIAKAVRDGTRFDTATSSLIIIAYAIPVIIFAVMLRIYFAGGSYLLWFPLRGLTSDNFDELTFWQQIIDYFHHLALPVLAMTISGFATLTLLTKNSFLDEIKKQYVMTARAKGLGERGVLYGHVFRNAMLIVVAGFPAAFISIFFTGSIIIEYTFSLDGLGKLGYEAALQRDYPVMFGTLYIFSLIGLVTHLVTDMVYVAIDPRIDFEARQ